MHYANTFARQDLFNGTGEVKIYNLLGLKTAPPFSAVLHCELVPGGLVGAHIQQRDPEIVIGMGGVGEAYVDGEANRLEHGDVVYLSHGQTLKIVNLSETETLSYMIIKARG